MIKSPTNRLQQQPRRMVDRQQQQSSGTNEFQLQMPQFDDHYTAARKQHAGQETLGERRNQHGQ